MQCEVGEDRVVAYLKGRIDTGNASQFEGELLPLASAHPDLTIELDARELDYLSSAGLRVLMRLMKQHKAGVRVVNANREVYEIFEVTGFTDLLEVRRSLREMSVDGLELIGSGANGNVYRIAADEMIKVFAERVTLDQVEAEREASRTAFTMGIPCAIPFDTVRVGDCYGTVFEMLDAATLSERIFEHPDKIDEYARKAGDLLRQLHTLEVPAGALSDGTVAYYRNVERLTDDFTEDEIRRLTALYDAIEPMGRFVHGDYHAKNIMESNGELMLIDLGESGRANPLFDLLHSSMICNCTGRGAGQVRADDEMSFFGLTFGQLRRFWEQMLAAYCEDAEGAARLDELLMPYARLSYLTAALGHPRTKPSVRKAYAEEVRTAVLAHAAEMVASVDELQSFVPKIGS